MKIGITGASGFIGSHLAEELIRRGHEVTGMVRPTSSLQWLRGLPIRLVRASPDRPDEIGAFVGGMDAVVHTAGSKFAPTRRDFRRANEDLTSGLLDAIEKHAPSLDRFVYLSSMAVLGPSADGTPLPEDAPPNPITDYGLSKLRTERLIRSRGARVPFTIIRPPGVYGPRDRDIFLVFQMAASGVQLIIGRRNTVDLIYIKNLVHAICLCLESSAAANRTYHVTDACAYTWEAFTRHIHRALGRSALVLKIPDSLLIAGGWIGQRAASWIGGEIKLNDQKVREMRERFWVLSSDRARAEIGYEPPCGVDQGVAETLAWYRAHRWL